MLSKKSTVQDPIMPLLWKYPQNLGYGYLYSSQQSKLKIRSSSEKNSLHFTAIKF